MLREKNNNPGNVFNAWKNYLENGLEISEVINPIIKDSWIRCREIGLSPYKSEIRMEKTDVLKMKQESHKGFINIITPYMNGLKANAQQMNIIMGLFDCGGNLIYLDGDKKVLETVLPLGVKEGVNFSEESAGTNAIAIAMKQNVPVAVCKHEHFCKDLHALNTASTPIFNTEGKAKIILGIIGLGANTDRSYLMTMLTSTAFFMEREMKIRRVWPRLSAYANLTKEIFEESKDAVLVLTNHGYIKQINSAGLKMLDIDNYIQLNEPFESFVKVRPSIIRLLEKNSEIPKEMKIKINTSAHSFEALAYIYPLLSRANKPIGLSLRLCKTGSGESSKNKTVKVKYSFKDIIGNSLSIQKSIALSKKAAKTSINVLIEGKSGTGKEMFAQAIHNAGERMDQPFIAVNCASIPKELIESELFGYEEGAFTGAKKEGSPGKFEAANGGTILLDEIGDMPLELQSRLLRVLESRTITRIGSSKEIPIDIRIIAATSKKITEMMESGEFRDDLYYRLSVVHLRIPSLKERTEDIPLLLDHFISLFNETMDGEIIGIEKTLKERLLAYDWPGNAREVRNMIEHVFGIETKGMIAWQHLSDVMRETLLYKSPLADPPRPKDLLSEERKKILDSQKEMYFHAIEISGGNMSKAASVLGIGRATLYRKLALLGIKK